ncbi:exocyst complex component Sec10-like protein [Obelidium mucronatum]|nr:exocyst complex component Sec10-like protein [Obelidium mucronatum]
MAATTASTYKDFRSFNAKEFINQKSSAGSANTKSAAISKLFSELEPKPLIKTFESALDDLLRLRRKVQSKIDDLEDAAQASENARRRKLTEMNSAVEDVQSAFKTLEINLGEVGKTAIRIGEQLETIDKQRRIATEAKDLVYYFQDFNHKRSGGAALDAFRKTSAETEAQTAPIVRRLNAIAKEMGIPGTEVAKENIEKFSEELETSILDQFHGAYVKGNRVVMNRCAKVLTDLNGGQSCVQTYINQHEFFINQSKVAADSMTIDLAKALKRGIASLNPKLRKLFDEVKATIPQEWDVISSVFPNSVSVMQSFQSVQNYIEQELSAAEQVNSTYYLRILAVTLHKFDKDVIVSETKSAGIASVIDRCFDDLFVPYTDDERYVEIERKCLKDRMTDILSVFLTFVSNRNKNPKAKSSMPLPSFQEAITVETSQIIRIVSTSDVSESYGIPSVTGHALERCKELSKIGDLSRNVLAVFKVLIEPELGGLEIVRVENHTINLFQLHFQTGDCKNSQFLRLLSFYNRFCQIPMLSQSPTIHRDAVITKNEFMETLETKMNLIIKTHVNAIQEWIETLLQKQKRADYKPKDEQMVSSPSTATCVQVCEFLNKVHIKAEIYFEGINLTGFLNEIGSIFHVLLLEHIKKFTFSDVGGLILARDLAKYFEVIQSFRIEPLTDKFEMIRELGNLFIVKPDNLQQVINGGHLSRIDVTLLTPFLMCRVDWNKVQKLGIFYTPSSI